MKDKKKIDGNCTCKLIVERIWASGYSSFDFIKPIFGSVVGMKKSASIEVLIEKIFVVDILVVYNATVEFHFGHSISWEYTNCPNKQRCYQKHHHRETRESPSTTKPHGHT